MIKKPKGKFIHARVDEQTYREFVEKARPQGGVSTILRKWINDFLKGTLK